MTHGREKPSEERARSPQGGSLMLRGKGRKKRKNQYAKLNRGR